MEVYSRIAMRIPFYFIRAAACIALFWSIQYLVLEHMPIWKASEPNMPNLRLVDFTTYGENSLALAEYYTVSSNDKLPISFNVSVFDTGSLTERKIVCRTNCSHGALSHCGKWLALAEEEGIYLYSTEDCRKGRRILIEPASGIYDMIWSGDNSLLLVRTERSVKLYSRVSHDIVAELAVEPHSTIVAPSASAVFLACSDGKYGMFAWATGKWVRDVPIDIGSKSIAVSSNLNFVAFSIDATVRLLDLAENKEIWKGEYRVPWGIKNSISFSRDDQRLAVIGCLGPSFSDYAVDIIDLRSQSKESSYPLENEVIAGVQFASDGTLWMWSANGAINNWNCSSPPSHSDALDQTTVRRKLLLSQFD